MKICVDTIGLAAGIAERCPDAEVGKPDGHDIVVAAIPRPIDVPCGVLLNSNNAVCNLIADPALRRDVQELRDISNDETATILFGFFNGEKFSELIEVAHSKHLMNSNVGPTAGFVTGAALRMPPGVVSAATMDKVRQFLGEIDYRGEVAIGLSERFLVTGLSLQHHPAYFALYAESTKQSAQNCLEFAAGMTDLCEVHDSVVLGNLLSRHPYPLYRPTDRQYVVADGFHVWRMVVGGGQEVLYITSHGRDLRTARQRMFGTINEIVEHETDLQFRTDVGYGLNFVAARDRYVQTKEPRPAAATVHA